MSNFNYQSSSDINECVPPMLFYKPILNSNEVAIFLGLSKSTIYKMVSRGEIPFHKRGKNLFFIQEEILQWIERS